MPWGTFLNSKIRTEISSYFRPSDRVGYAVGAVREKRRAVLRYRRCSPRAQIGICRRIASRKRWKPSSLRQIVARSDGVRSLQPVVLNILHRNSKRAGDPRALDIRLKAKVCTAQRSSYRYYSGRPGSGICAGTVDPERIILTAGTGEAYSYIFRLLCEPGDEILFPAPSYPLLGYLATLNDVKLVPYPLFYDHGWHMDLAALRAALTPRSRAVLVVHPNNPTGSFVMPKEATELHSICAEREMAIVSDQVFLDYSAESKPHSTFAFDGPALAFTLSGLSKISALPQMKLAWLIASGPQTPKFNAQWNAWKLSPIRFFLPALQSNSRCRNSSAFAEKFSVNCKIESQQISRIWILRWRRTNFYRDSIARAVGMPQFASPPQARTKISPSHY